MKPVSGTATSGLAPVSGVVCLWCGPVEVILSTHKEHTENFHFFRAEKVHVMYIDIQVILPSCALRNESQAGTNS